MTDYFFGALGFQGIRDAQEMTQSWVEQCKPCGIRIEICSCEEEWFLWVNKLLSTPKHLSICFYLHTDEPEGFSGFSSTDYADFVREVFYGKSPPLLANHLPLPVPQPLTAVDWKSLLRIAQDENKSHDSSNEEALERAIEFYKGTRFARCLREIWHTEGLQEGIFALSEGWSVRQECVFEMEFDDVLQDLWLHYCFGYVDVDTAYWVRKLNP